MFPVPVRILRPCVALALASALPLWACSVDPAAETAALQARGLQAGPGDTCSPLPSEWQPKDNMILSARARVP